MTSTANAQAEKHSANPGERVLSPRPRDTYYCSPSNWRGLRATRTRRGDRIVVRFRGDESHQGGIGMLHGGVIAALFDEAMGSVPVEVLGAHCATGTLNVIYRHPAPTGEELVIEAWHEEVDGRKVHLAGVAQMGGTLIAEATATFIHMGESHFTSGHRPPPPREIP